MVWKETWRLLHTAESRIKRTENLGQPRPLPKSYVPQWRSVYDRLPKGLIDKPYHCPPRLKKLAKPKSFDPGYHPNRLRPFDVSQAALTIETSDRMRNLCRPKKRDPKWLPPRYPYWIVNPNTLKFIPSQRLVMLSQPIIRVPAHPVASSFKQKPAGIAYLEKLAEPRPRHPDFLAPRTEFWRMTKEMKAYKTSEKMIELSIPKPTYPSHFRDSDEISQAVLTHVASERLEELAIPLARRRRTKL